MEMMTSWERQGFKEGEKRGRQKGREEGRKEEHRKSTLRILTHRFGELDQSLQSQISKLSPTKLDALFDAALEFTSKDELIAWLQQP